MKTNTQLTAVNWILHAVVAERSTSAVGWSTSTWRHSSAMSFTIVFRFVFKFCPFVIKSLHGAAPEHLRIIAAYNCCTLPLRLCFTSDRLWGLSPVCEGWGSALAFVLARPLSLMLQLELCAGRAAPRHRRRQFGGATVAADNLSARHRCPVAVFSYFVAFFRLPLSGNE